MYLEQKNYKRKTIQQLIYNDIRIVNGGFPIFNDFNHTTLDMSKLKGKDRHHTLSIKIDDERYITFSFMKLDSEHIGGKMIDIDVKLYGSKNTKVIDVMGNNKTMVDTNLFTIVSSN